ncbi:LOW QUALITY PROTEIN: U-box domain-containing protein 3 [Pyrus x bretschneideri]|uniref:LOW QUALITY PROTEIN: U-box domain-containing protein 3 n=1 Tax=Pyrus x bretschneideri TaxID=225117 RepID=UPI00202DC68D|nr:LOW QUALITY PROTEIN: U-box domain-containing protein 3 [Pyrus x bretschneideri]
MDKASIKCLINSISRFVHLVSSQTSKHIPIQKDYRTIVDVLKLLKPLLDEVVDFKIPSDDILYKECDELDMAVNGAREFMEKWSPKSSKILSAWWSEPLLITIQSLSLKICGILPRLLQSSSSGSSLTGLQHCMQEIQSLKLERVSEYLEEALKSPRKDVMPSTKLLMTIIELLNLTSNQELLKESIAVEKERMNVEVSDVRGELDQVNQIVVLVSHIREFIVKIEHLETASGVPIPSYFRCPLSSELMLDPVIVASGQTYERSSIQKWIDHGLTICPKTRQRLSHTNLLPNYTVKAMIESWSQENDIKLTANSDGSNAILVPSPSDQVSPADSIHTDSLYCSTHSSNSTSRSSLEVGNVFEKQKKHVSPRLGGQKSNECDSNKKGHSSPKQSYSHCRSESATSAASSIDYALLASIKVSGISNKHENVRRLSGEISSEHAVASTPDKESTMPPGLSGKLSHISKAKAEGAWTDSPSYPNRQLLPFSSSGSDELTTASHVRKLIEDLQSQSNEVQTMAAEELRLLGKRNTENRTMIGQCGAITPLLSLLYSGVMITQEHAVTALLNLSINEDNKAMIAEAGAIDPLIHVLKTGSDGAKENSAAALFSISVLDEYKAKIGRSGAVKALVDLLASGTLRGKKDAATALFNLSIFHENKVRLVQAGAVKHLIDLMDPDTGMVDKAVALLANLSTIAEGRVAIAREGGIPLLVEIVESGSQRGKENAASILLQLCLHSPKFCTLVLQEGAVPPLVALSQSGTPRAKEKAQQLLSHFRNQREGAMGKGK